MRSSLNILAALLIAASLAAQTPDTILVNGKILTVDADDSIAEALAIREGRISAVGTTAAIRATSGPATRVIDLGGRTVIPGLIDSHLHAIRAALSFATEVDWVGARSIPQALRRISDAAASKPEGSWLIVAGGWNVNQFAERRAPTQAELTAAAPDNPVYVQLGYTWAMLTPRAYEVLGLTEESQLPGGGRFEMEDGKRTGAVAGGIIELFELLPKPTFDEQVAGTKAFFRELNRLGMTGVGDPGGNNLTPDLYQALFKVWRDGELTVRVAYSIAGQTDGAEFDDFQRLTTMLPQGFGDEMLHFNGLGERITAAVNNNNNPSTTDKEELYQILKWAADRGMTITIHWANDVSAHHLLEVFDSVNREVPIRDLRWSIAHLNDASEETLRRMAALGVGWTVQDAMYFGGDALVARGGEEAGLRIPPVNTATRVGVVVGGGTDAHRVASYNPFTSLQWFLDGKTVSGVAIRGPEETPTREDALRFYTLGSAWFSHDEDVRGSLEVGKVADLAVLSADYMTIPLDQVGELESVLTMVGGKVVYASGPFEQR